MTPWPGSWELNLFPPTQTVIDTTEDYPRTQPNLGNASAGDSSHPTVHISPWYPTSARVDGMTQHVNYQSYNSQHPSDRRTPFPQAGLPTSHQSTHYPTPQPPSGSDPPYPHSGSSTLRPRGPTSTPRHFRRVFPHSSPDHGISNQTPGIHPHNYADPQPPACSRIGISPDGSSQTPNLASSTRLPSPLGEGPPHQYSHTYPLNCYPQSPAPEPSALPARPKGRKAMGHPHPYTQSGRKTGRKAAPPDEPPVASSSRVTLDMHPPPVVRGGKRKTPTPVSPPAQALRTAVDQCTPRARERDAERKRGYRGDLKRWFGHIAGLLPPSQLRSDTRLKTLTRSEHKSSRSPERASCLPVA